MTTRLLLLSDFECNGGTKTYFKQLLSFYKEKSILRKCICINRNSSLTQIELENIKKYFEVKYFPQFYTQDNIKKYPIFFFIFRIFFCFFVGIQYEKIIVSTGNYFHFTTFAAFKKQFFYILHTYPTKNNYNLKLRPKYLLLKFYYFIISKINFKIITVSNFSKNQILKVINNNLENISVVYNYVPIQTSVIKKNRNNNILVLTVGHVESWKNPMYWLKIAESVCEINKNIKFAWVGAGSLRETMIEQTPVYFRHKIIWINEKDNIEEYYKNADIYFQPSLVESFGLSVTEAMSFGLPCIVSNVGGMPEIIDNKINGLVFNLDSIDDAIQKIIYLSNNEIERNKISEKAIFKIKKNFSKIIWTKKMNNILNEK